MTTQCVRCRGEVDGTAYACRGCGVRKAAGQLTEIADMLPAARDIATGQAHYNGSGGGSGKPGSRLPLDLTATAKLDGVAAALGSWARLVAEERNGRPIAHAGDDPIAHAAAHLAANLEWLRHQRFADEFLTDVEAAARVVRGLARGRAEQRYLGPCGAPTQVDATTFGNPPESEFIDGPACDGDVYAIVHTDGTTARAGSCRTCKATVDTAERQAWLDAEVRQYAYRASEIHDAYGVSADTIRSWAARGHLTPHGHDREGRPLFNLAEVLDLAAASAARREGERAARARRAAVRQTAEMGA